jgi:hypothetical protein
MSTTGHNNNNKNNNHHHHHRRYNGITNGLFILTTHIPTIHIDIPVLFRQKFIIRVKKK